MRRVKGWTSSTIVLGLVLAGLAVAPSASAVPDDVPVVSAGVAGGAAKKKAPRFTVSKKRTTKVTKPFTLTTTYRLPVLKGSTARNRALVTKHAKKLLAAEKKSITARYTGCLARWEDPFIEATVKETAIYRGRYASVGMAFNSFDGCGSTTSAHVRAFTLDLVTGKTVKMSMFAAPMAKTTQEATFLALRRQNKECVDPMLEQAPQPDDWTVSPKGLRLWFAKYAVASGGCDIVSALVPWTDVATAKQLTGKRFTRTYVSGLRYSGPDDYDGSVATFTVQGRLVAQSAVFLNSEGGCMIGVRTGKKARLFNAYWNERVVVPLGGTTARPTRSLGKGWREATSKDHKILAKLDLAEDAISACLD